MPLSQPVARKESHTRRITCQGYDREDGLWDIEGHLVDTRGYTYVSIDRGEIHPGTPGHEMWLRWTVGTDLVIREIEVVTDSSPYPTSCPKAANSYQKLVGLAVGKGFMKQVQALVARDECCTHLNTLIQAAANATMQTLAGRLWSDDSHQDKLFGGDLDGKPALLGSCLSYAPGNSVVSRIWPLHFRGKPDAGK